MAKIDLFLLFTYFLVKINNNKNMLSPTRSFLYVFIKQRVRMVLNNLFYGICLHHTADKVFLWHLHFRWHWFISWYLFFLFITWQKKLDPRVIRIPKERSNGRSTRNIPVSMFAITLWSTESHGDRRQTGETKAMAAKYKTVRTIRQLRIYLSWHSEAAKRPKGKLS